VKCYVSLQTLITTKCLKGGEVFSAKTNVHLTSLYMYVCIYTGYTQKNGAVSKVKKEIYFSPYMGATYTVSRDNCPSFSRVNHNPSM